MTKKELLNRFAECEDKLKIESRMDADYGNLNNKKKLISEYCTVIQAALMFCPDDFSLDGLSSLEGLEEKNALAIFIKENDAETIKIKLNTIFSEIKTLANCYAGKNSEKLRNTATALAIRNEWSNARQNKNHKKIFPFFIVGFVILSIIVVVFAGLDAAKYFAEDTAMAKVCAIVSTVAGALDAVNGVAFFIYERHDDKKKKENQENLDQALSGKIQQKNSNNVIKAGKGSTVHIGDNKSTGDPEDLLATYVFKNSRNIIHTKNKSHIDIGDNY